MSEVLVTALLSRISEIEAKAEEAKARKQDARWTRSNGNSVTIRYRERVLSPDEVLRLCRAHRDLIDEREKAAIHLRWTMANGGGEYDARRELARWDQVLSIVAGGLGVEETTDE